MTRAQKAIAILWGVGALMAFPLVAPFALLAALRGRLLADLMGDMKGGCRR